MWETKNVKIPSKRSEAHKWLLQFKEINENWLEEVKAERTGSQRTVEAYLDHIRWFITYMDMTPTEIIAKAAEEQKREMTSGLKRKTWAERKALALFNKLQEEGRARTGAKGVYTAVRSFFRYNGVIFKGKSPKATTKSVAKLPSNQQLSEAWKTADVERKLPNALLRSTGWRPEDILTLKWSELQDQYDSQHFYIEKVTEKEDLRVNVYLTAETSELVRIIKRQRFGDAEPPTTEAILPYNYDTLLYHVQKFGESMGIKFSPKYYRKLFRTRCSPIIGQDNIFKMAGWTLPGVGKHYTLPSPEDCLKNYLRIEQLLTFEPKAVSKKEQVINELIAMAIGKGMPFEEAQKMKIVFRAKAVSVEEAAKMIDEQLKQVQPAGGLPFEIEAAKTLARILKEAFRQLKEENVS